MCLQLHVSNGHVNLCVCVCVRVWVGVCVFQWAAEELTVNERPSPCPQGSMGCRRSGRRRGTSGSWWTSCCLLGSSSISTCLEMTPSGPSKRCDPFQFHQHYSGNTSTEFSEQKILFENKSILMIMKSQSFKICAFKQIDRLVSPCPRQAV